MIKNIMVLGFLTWLTLGHAADHHVAREVWGESEQFKVEKANKEKDAARSLAGGKFKKKKNKDEEGSVKDSKPTDSNSEVQYWKYSE